MGLGKGSLENLVNIDGNFWRSRSVLVTGHTGFKGGWLAAWLHGLGAQVHGYALDPPTVPSLFEVARVGAMLASDTRADVADLDALRRAIDQANPEIVFHLAAQPIVREGYRTPIETLKTNIVGTAHLLEAVRTSGSVRAVVVVTSDKVYENRERAYPYREADPLGGRDPYSASKACAEIVTSSYRASFFTAPSGHPARVASVRAGNVVGGGDWAADRLVPDCNRAFAAGEPVRLRFPGAVRPWQHVLEPLSGYLQLASRLLSDNGEDYARAWNFGPDAADVATVRDVVEWAARLWGAEGLVDPAPSADNPHEAGLLHLDSTLARSQLGWRPRWSVRQALERTVAWQKAWLRGDDMTRFSVAQITDYSAGARR